VSLVERVEGLRDTVLDDTYKGIPLGATVPLGEIGRRGWNAARGDLALPVTTLHGPRVEANLRGMAEYCARHGADLAPHGKTTMAPQLFARQLEHGARALTAATPTQVALMRRFGVPRIILANQLVEPAALRWVAGELAADPEFEFLCLVDDAAAVAAMDDVLAGTGLGVSLPVLLEVGLAGGRGGVRSEASAMAVAEAVRGARHLRLTGVETYEGLVASGGSAADLAEVDGFLAGVADIARLLADKGLYDTAEVIVTAGGSAYFDRVVAALGGAALGGAALGGLDATLVLRSGAYVTHDSGKYARLSPLDGRRATDEPLRLRDALTGWGAVLSRPQEDTAIVGIGKRDVPYDAGLPQPHTVYRADGSRHDISPVAETVKVMDQHTLLRLDPGTALRPGDIVAFGLSHPCTAFDKLKLLPVVDDDATVVDAVLTFF
jgi:D-serine dehydratase